MKSVMEILNLVVDGQINTREEAARIVDEETTAIADSMKISEEAARAQVLHNIGYASGYLSRGMAYRILDLFETVHPYFGPAPWPSSEEIFKMGMKMGEESLKP